MTTEHVLITDHKGREVELRPIWIPHHQGYAFAARDGRVFGRGRTLEEAFASLRQAGLLSASNQYPDKVA